MSGKTPRDALGSRGAERKGRCRVLGKEWAVSFVHKRAPCHLGLKPRHQLCRLSCYSPHFQTVILSCKLSLRNSSWTHTFLCLPTASSWVQVPSSPFLEPVKASVQLSCPPSSPLSSVFYFAARLLALSLGCDYKTATHGEGALDREP